MKLWKISQTANRDYDTYDAAIVAARTAEVARTIHPSGRCDTGDVEIPWDSWCSLDEVTVEYLGMAAEGTKQGVILSSYNAG